MKLRSQGLESADPLAVPLPSGTEVTTRAARHIAGRLVDAGALGRVVGRDGDRITVRIVGVGDGIYARGELVPRKLGQLRYAERRHSAWQALAPARVIDCVVGSRAWNLADASSDTDRRGVFVLPFSWTTGLVQAPVDLVSEDASETYWDVGKTIRQAIRADPNTLELLFLPGAEAVDEMGAWLLEARDAFASAEIYGSFGRYALSQLSKLQQSLRLAEHRALLLDWLRADHQMDLDHAATHLASHAELAASASADRVGPSSVTGRHQANTLAKEYIKQLYSSLFDQGLLAARNFAALASFARSPGHPFELPRELRPKNAYNLLRLIATATTWLRTGRPSLEVAEPLRAELLAIKRGDVALAEVLVRAQELSTGLEEARAHTVLPARADVGRADALLRRIRREAARRFLDQVPGVFGADAPTLSEAVWT